MVPLEQSRDGRPEHLAGQGRSSLRPLAVAFLPSAEAMVRSAQMPLNWRLNTSRPCPAWQPAIY